MIYPKQKREVGFTLLVTSVSAFVLVGMLGLAADLGRVYIAKNEAQAFADFASIAAARKLNGKQSGIDAANAEVANSTNKWNFGTQSFTSGIRTVEFAIKPATGAGSNTCPSAGPWVATPSAPFADYGCVRVTATPSVNLLFMPVLGTAFTQVVTGQAVAGVVPQSFPLGGYMPFTPFAHEPNCSSTVTSGCDPTGNYGYSVGQEYGFLWPSNVTKGNACQGDQVNWPLYNVSDQVSGSTRGYFELQAASSISAAILGASQTDPLAVGDQLNMTNGQKQAEQNALMQRASYDTDQTAYANNNGGVAPNYTGNGMRLVVMPVNSGPNTAPPFTVLGFASFLLPMTYPNGGNKAWCAIYMGSTTAGGGGTSPFDVAGAYVVRLTQ